MKNFLKNNGLWVLFAAAVIAVALALMSVFSNTSSPLTNLANTIASPFRSAYTAVAEWFNDKQKYYQDYTGLEEENARLRQQIASMEAEIRQARDDSAENERSSGGAAGSDGGHCSGHDYGARRHQLGRYADHQPRHQ